MNILLSLILSILLISCEKKQETTTVLVDKKPEVVSLSGGILKIQTSDDYKDLITDSIVLDNNQIIPEGTMFRIVSESLLISDNNADWVKELLLPSKSGKINFSVKPGTVPGLYRITIYPLESTDVIFPKNLNARFFIEVTSGVPFEIKSIVSERFEDLSPFNNLKDSNESWIISSDVDLVSYITVGPIVDKFGNLVSQGKIQLNISEGTIIGDNPQIIADGYSYFSYRPNGNVGDLTVSAILTDVSNVNLIKNISMKMSKPNLEFLDGGDFSDMLDGETKSIIVRLKNSGSLPVTNLSLNISDPFIIITEDSTCKERVTLKSQEICSIKIQYTRQNILSQNGNIQIIGQPSSFSSSTVNLPLIVNNVQPASLSLSESVLSFQNVSCGTKETKEIYVLNSGTFSATNIGITQPPSTVVGQQPYFKIILPNQDASPDPNPETIINCGTTFPAGRKCRILLEFEPLSYLPNQPVVGLINADSLPSLTISMNGSAVAGTPTGIFPITFYKYLTTTPTSTMFAQNGQKTTVKVGPITDTCGNPITNGSSVSASVSGGTLNTLITTTTSGYAEFTWNALSVPELLGNQTITVTNNGNSRQGTITFQGVNLTLSGSSNFDQVVIEKPKESTYTITNNGNIKAENISFIFTDPLALKDSNNCSNGILVGQSCSFIVESRPTQNLDYNSSIFVSSSTFGINAPSLNNILTKGRNKPVITFDSTKYLFNDGTNNSTISKIITIRNNGPAISYNTVISVDSPYVITTNNCLSTILVNQSCSLTIQVSRSSAIGAGNKLISISNEIETLVNSSTLTYSELLFGNQTYSKYKKYYCIGPFTISAVGSGGIGSPLSQTTIIDLSSDSGKVLFYNDSSCNTKVTSTSIMINSSVSSNFYIRSISAETTNVIGTSGLMPSAIRTFVFEDIINDVLTFKPAIAIKNGACIFCHSNIKGNIVTDFNFNVSQNTFHGLTTYGSGDYVTPGDPYWTGLNGTSAAFGTSYIEGKIYTPKILLGNSSKTNMESVISTNKPTYFDSMTPVTINTIAEHLNSSLAHRTTDYLNLLFNFSNAHGTFTKDLRINPRNISIREIKNIKISYPSSANITSFLDNLGTFKYYKWFEDTSFNLSNFGLRYGNFFGNTPGQIMDCDGDLFVDGPIYLKDLQLRTTNGCRIYSTGTVFIEAQDGLVEREGITFIDITSTSNIQISSAKGILLGLDESIITSRKAHDSSDYGPSLSTLDSDIAKIKDGSNISLLKDAANSGERKVTFSRILLNAPRVDSRYSGDFSGVLITTHSIWSLGHFTYFYDNVFDSIPILPFLSPETFFSVEDCVLNNIDQSIIKDSSTNFRSCYP